MSTGNNISVATAARLMGVSQQYIRVGMQRKLLPIGTAIQISSKRYTYYISPKLFEDYTGMTVGSTDLETDAGEAV